MNAFSYRKIITPRRLRLNYVSPGICEGDFSSTGRQEISLLPLFVKKGPTGLIMEVRFGKYRLLWNRIPGALCYSIYRLSDKLNPFSPYILVAECIPTNYWDTEDDGIYCVTAITPEGETECSTPAEVPDEELPDPPPLPEPDPEPDVPAPAPPGGTCGDGTPAVPENFLEELDVPEFVCEATANGATPGSVDFTMPSGRIATKYISGWLWDDCRAKVPPVPVIDASVSNTWLVYEGEIDGYFGIGFGCYNPTGPVGGPLDCSPSLADQVETEFPGGIMDHSILGCADCGPRTFSPTDPRVGQTWTFTIPGSIQAGACPSGGLLNMQIVRTHTFIPQAETLTIQSFASIKDTLFCVTGADAGPQWNGIIDDTFAVFTDQYQCAETDNGEFVGNVRVAFVDVRFIAGEKWTISIIGILDGNYVQVFAGEKRYGQTARGNYGRTGGCSTLGCLTLT